MRRGLGKRVMRGFVYNPYIRWFSLAGLMTVVIIGANLFNEPLEEPTLNVTAPLVTLPPLPPAALEPELIWKDGQFGKRPFYNQLMDLGLTGAKIHSLINTLTPVYDFRRSHPSHKWRMGFKDEIPVQFALSVSPAEIYDIYAMDSEPNLVRRDIKTFVRPAVVHGVIEDSLFRSLSEAKQASALAARLEKVFAWDIDFYTDPRKGDSFEILVEETYIEKEGEPVFNGYGSILAARYHARNDVVDAFLFDLEDEEGYYSSGGKSLVRDFLRSPLKLQYVTSSFSRKRFHPVLKRYRAHNGVDYRANKNTPVMAVANGRVSTAGRLGGAGIAVEIKHRNKMLTQYFHLNKIASGVRPGARVKQGQVIGYVGKTGYATSYHLHFGMKINNKYVDPQTQRFEPGVPIPQKEMARFENQMQAYLDQLEGSPATTVAKKSVQSKALKPKKL